MMFTIDKYFVEQFNARFGTKLTYAQFKEFYTVTRQHKKDLGLVKEMVIIGHKKSKID